MLDLALVHYPVYDRGRGIVATSVTNLDIHDIARSARTYGVDRYYIIHPVEKQREMVAAVADYWRRGEGRAREHPRFEAMNIIRLAPFVEDAVDQIAEETGQHPLLIGTAAWAGSSRPGPAPLWDYCYLRERLCAGDRALILLGTGWGLSEDLLTRCDALVPGIRANGSFNHLSVRTAAAVLLERIVGERGIVI